MRQPEADIDLVTIKRQSLHPSDPVRRNLDLIYYACSFSGYLRGDNEDPELAESWNAAVAYCRMVIQ